MKKLLLLLTLSFFSIQGFAAGCPDGSEPVKSISADGTYFVFECNKSSSESTTEGNRESNIFDSIDENDKIVFKAENEQYIVHVFTDADCPSCAKFHSNMQRMNALGITVKYLAYPLEGIHPGVQSKMEKIWCAEDKAIAMHNYKTNRNLPNSPDCVNPVAEQLAIGKKLEIWGTPTIFFEDVPLEAGYWYPEELLEELSTGLPLSLAASQELDDDLLKSARIDAKQKISGFTFTQMDYHKMVKKDGVLVKSVPETEITGWYQFIPKENDWHTGIIFFEKGQLKWKNEAGVEWNLQPDINNNKLITGEDNPYQTEYEPNFMLMKTSEKSKSVSQSEEYPTVDYNSNLLELCKRDVEGLWTNKIKEGSFLFVVASENGNCEYGRGNTKYNAFKNCTKNQEDSNIVGICELYGEAGEVVWDGHSKPSKDKNKENASSKKYPTVNYNTNVKELCQGHIAANWKGYMEHNSSGYFFAVVGEDGRCEHGVGRTKEDAFNECTKWQEENNIVGTCELYGEAGEVVWDGSVWDDSVKASKSASKEVSTLETNESVDYVERLKQVKALLDSGIINQDDFEKMKQKIIDTMN